MKSNTKSPIVAIVRYEKALESVRKAVERSHGLDHLPADAKVFIKPNIVFWTKVVPFPKWGVITTSRVVEDAVVILRSEATKNLDFRRFFALPTGRDHSK